MESTNGIDPFPEYSKQTITTLQKINRHLHIKYKVTSKNPSFLSFSYKKKKEKKQKKEKEF